MTPLRPYLAILTLTTLATIWAGSAIAQRERRIEVLKTAAAWSGDKQLSAREAGNSEDTRLVSPPVGPSGYRQTAGSPVRPEIASAAIKRGRQSSDLHKLALAASKLCGVPPDLFLALIARESSWNPGALSRAGAVGLTQTMPATARGLDPTLNLWDPWENLLAGGCTLRQYYDRFGTWPAALHSYHGGPTRVREGRVLQESRDYARQIMEGSE